MFTITIKKEVQIRFCKIRTLPDGNASMTAYADGIAYISEYIHPSLDHARTSCETVQLGGVVHWQRQDDTWTSDSVLCENGGIRLTPSECELARKVLARPPNARKKHMTCPPKAIL
jgi:hypothetical protein